jgi:DNA-binding MarR family transcriptional regulator
VPSRSHDHYAAEAAVRIALREFAARTDRIARAHELTAERYELLLLIEAAGEGEATVGKLARQLHIGQSAATQLARRVEDAGLIERTVSPTDARVHPLRLTAEGERRLAAAAADLTKERAMLADAVTAIPRR